MRKLLKFKSAFLKTRCCHLTSSVMDSFSVSSIKRFIDESETEVSLCNIVLIAMEWLKCHKVTYYMIQLCSFISN